MSDICIIGAGIGMLAILAKLSLGSLPKGWRITIIQDRKFANSPTWGACREGLITNTALGVNSIAHHDPTDCLTWMVDYLVKSVDEDDLVDRWVLGEYFEQRLENVKQRLKNDRIHLQLILGRATAITQYKDCWSITYNNYDVIKTKALFLATGLPNANPWPELQNGKIPYASTPYVAEMPSLAKANQRFLVVGSCLSGVEAVLQIARINPLAHITAVSKTGFFPSVRIHNNQKSKLNLSLQDILAACGGVNVAKTALQLLLRRMKEISSSPLRLKPTGIDSNGLSCLAQDVASCEAGENQWQDITFDFFVLSLQLAPFISSIELVKIRRLSQTFIERYMAAMPLSSAKELLRYMMQGRVQIVKTAKGVRFQKDIEHHRIVGQGELSCLTFDAVINATGLSFDLGKKDALYISLRRELCAKNEHAKDEIALNASNLRCINSTDDLPAYIVGGLASNVFWVTNAIFSVAFQANMAVSNYCYLLGRRIQRHPSKTDLTMETST